MTASGAPRLGDDRALVRVRRAEPRDAALLASLGGRLFAQTFAAASDPADLAAHIASTFTPDVQRRELEGTAHVYFIAEREGEAVGYALLRESRPPACVTHAGPIELGRIYVDHRWHGSGVAERLVTHLLAEARARGAGAVWLGVWAENQRAVRFYERLGFRDVGTHTFWFGNDPQTDQVMVLALSP